MPSSCVLQIWKSFGDRLGRSRAMRSKESAKNGEMIRFRNRAGEDELAAAAAACVIESKSERVPRFWLGHATVWNRRRVVPDFLARKGRLFSLNPDYSSKRAIRHESIRISETLEAVGQTSEGAPPVSRMNALVLECR